MMSAKERGTTLTAFCLAGGEVEPPNSRFSGVSGPAAGVRSSVKTLVKRLCESGRVRPSTGRVLSSSSAVLLQRGRKDGTVACVATASRMRI